MTMTQCLPAAPTQTQAATELLESVLSEAAARGWPAHWLPVLNAALIAAEIERLHLARPDCLAVMQGAIFFDWLGQDAIVDRVIIAVRQSGLVHTSVQVHPERPILRRTDHTVAGMLRILRWAPILGRAPVVAHRLGPQRIGRG